MPEDLSNLDWDNMSDKEKDAINERLLNTEFRILKYKSDKKTFSILKKVNNEEARSSFLEDKAKKQEVSFIRKIKDSISKILKR